MGAIQRQRARELLQASGIDRAVFAHPASVTWLTGLSPMTEMGASPFSGGPALALYAGGHFTLLCLDAHARPADGVEPAGDLTILAYEGYTVERAPDGPGRMAAALRDALGHSLTPGSFGVELAALAALYLDIVQQACPAAAIRPIDGLLTPLRMRKTDDELALIRQAFALGDVGYQAARGATRPGASEISVWSAVASAIYTAAGQRVPLGNDCVVSTRDFNVGGLPADLPVRAGDSMMIDLSVNWRGYWSDGCRVMYASEPTAEQAARHRFIEQALEHVISLARPGVKANELDAAARTYLERHGYPVFAHHTGHGVGVSFHEEPRITPYNDTVLEPGMVIMLEPGTYVPGVSACRLEDGLLIQPDGVEILSRYPLALPGEDPAPA